MVEAFAVLDGFPPLLDGGEVLPLTPPAHDPEPSLSGVAGQAPPNGEMLDHLVLADAKYYSFKEAGRI